MSDIILLNKNRIPVYNNRVPYRPQLEEAFIWTTGFTSGGFEARKYTNAGVLSTSVKFTTGVFSAYDSVVVNSDIYFCGDLFLRKSNSLDGSVIWQNTYSVPNNYIFICMATDNSNLYLGSNLISSQTTHKYDLDGNLIFQRNHGAIVRGIGVDSQGNFYTHGDRTSNLTTRKYNSSGTLQWSVDYGASPGAAKDALVVDSNDNIYVCGLRNSNITTRKYNSSGVQLATYDHGNTVLCLAVDKNDFLYTAGVVSSSLTTRKYDTSGTLIWSRNHGGNVYDIKVDSVFNVYTVGVVSSSITTRKYDKDGNLLWTANHGQDVYSVALTNV